jgi:hypothetical protein
VSEKESQEKGDEAPPHFVAQILVGFRAAIPSQSHLPISGMQVLKKKKEINRCERKWKNTSW